MIKWKTLLYCVGLCSMSLSSQAQVLFEFDNLNKSTSSTYLISLQQGTQLSEEVKGFKNVQYESSEGNVISLKAMYTPKIQNIRALFLTSFDENSGLLWGFTTGERAQKYTIDPSITLGWIQRWTPYKRHSITLKAIATYGGKLKEHTCLADYGDIAGLQTVNCRLAATVIAPEESLAFLENKRPKENKISVEWTYMF